MAVEAAGEVGSALRQRDLVVACLVQVFGRSDNTVIKVFLGVQDDHIMRGGVVGEGWQEIQGNHRSGSAPYSKSLQRNGMGVVDHVLQTRRVPIYRQVSRDSLIVSPAWNVMLSAQAWYPGLNVHTPSPLTW